MILDQLAKDDNKWRLIALKICKDKSLADDITNDMYLKVKDYQEVSVYFIIVTLRNLFYNVCKKRKEVCISEYDYLKCNNRTFEPTDQEQQILENFDKIRWHQQEIIRETYDRSYREIQREFNINRGYVYREVKKAKQKIFNNGENQELLRKIG